MFTTISLFNQFLASTGGTAASADIEMAIPIATDYMENFFDRKMFSQTHYEQHWIDNTNYFMLNEWPITSLEYLYTNPQNNISYHLDKNYKSVLVKKDENDLLVIIDAVNSYTIDLSAQGTMGNIATALEAISGISQVNVIYPEIPTDFIYMPTPHTFLTHNNSYGQGQLQSFLTNVAYHLEPNTNSVVRLDKNLNCFSYTKYIAGYVAPVDNSDHSALDIVGNVPKVLTDICNRLVLLLLTQWNNNGVINSSQLASEKLGDYAYTLRPNDHSAVENLLISFQDILEKYKRKTIAI